MSPVLSIANSAPGDTLRSCEISVLVCPGPCSALSRSSSVKACFILIGANLSCNAPTPADKPPANAACFKLTSLPVARFVPIFVREPIAALCNAGFPISEIPGILGTAAPIPPAINELFKSTSPPVTLVAAAFIKALLSALLIRPPLAPGRKENCGAKKARPSCPTGLLTIFLIGLVTFFTTFLTDEPIVSFCKSFCLSVNFTVW